MQEYHFTIILADVDVMTEDMSEALFEAGCDDGSPCSGMGVAKIKFHRESQSLETAVASAVNNVRAAGLQVSRVQIDSQELAELPAFVVR